MAEHDLWVGRCHVKARHPDARQWSATVDEAVVVAVVMASDAATGHALVSQRLNEIGLDLLTFEHVQTLLQRFREQGMSQPLVDLADRTSTASPVAFGEMLPLLLEPETAPPTREADTPPEPTYTEIDWDELFGTDQPPLWAVIDGVNCREVMARVTATDVQSACLYASADPDTRAMAPWLVRLEADGDILPWLRSLPQDQHWGILLQSHATLKQLRTHLRKFTMLWTPANDQAPVYFRFYDPRVALDMSQALASWKLAALMAPIEALVMGLSPSMVFPPEFELTPSVGLDAGAAEVQGRLLRLAPGEEVRSANGQGRQFEISNEEYQCFGELVQARSRQTLARSLAEPYPRSSAEERRRVAHDAWLLSQRYQLTSTQQLETLARCVMEVGPDFPQRHPDARQILDNSQVVGWRKREQLAAWLPRGRVRSGLLSAHGDSASENNYRPLTDEERP